MLSFASGMAAISAALLALVGPDDVVVVPSDGYYQLREVVRTVLLPAGVEVRSVPTQADALREAIPGASYVWIETPSNPGLDVVDLAEVAGWCQAADARLLVDNTLLTPYLQRPLELGADLVVASATKALSGHSDVLMGYVAAPTAEALAPLLAWRTLHGAVPGPFEAWLAHRSLATLGVRMERQSATAGALVSLLREHPAVGDVRYPGRGGVLCFTLASEAAAEAFLAGAALVADATSFGGVHASAERRARWGTDDVAPGFLRFSCGIEDTADLVADVAQALDAVG